MRFRLVGQKSGLVEVLHRLPVAQPLLFISNILKQTASLQRDVTYDNVLFGSYQMKKGFLK